MTTYITTHATMYASTHFDFHVSGLEVQSDLQLEMVHNGGEYLHPVLLQRSEAMWGNGHSTELWLPTLETENRPTLGATQPQ